MALVPILHGTYDKKTAMVKLYHSHTMSCAGTSDRGHREDSSEAYALILEEGGKNVHLSFHLPLEQRSDDGYA
jgi:hypothetical protein